MKNLIRTLALFLRQRSEQHREIELLRRFEEWRLPVLQFPEPLLKGNKVAIIRLDDIGDYLLFRNFLSAYKQSSRFKDYSITLIGNIVWKPVFEFYDAAAVDAVLWIDKKQYFENEAYRQEQWQKIRNENFETVICPSRTRPLLIDDLITLATGARFRIGCENSFASPEWNKVSDRIYDELLPGNVQQHEFYFNRDFARRSLGMELTIAGPYLPYPVNPSGNSETVICFIGASAKSKTWPVHYWISLVQSLKENGFTPLLSGGQNEQGIAARIVTATQAASVVGQTTLVETLAVIAASKAVITGDTMAAHAAVSFKKPTVILANGVNAKRFVAYEDAGFDFVKTVYTRQFIHAAASREPYRAVTKDMVSILPAAVLAALKGLLR